MILEATKIKIYMLIYLFETGSKIPKYHDITVMRDGKNRTMQITYGKMQTTEQGNLKALIELYIAKGGVYGEFMKPYLSKFGVENLSRQTMLIQALSRAGLIDPIMRTVQDEFFDKLYYDPAFAFFEKEGFVEPLSLAIIFDSYIHSGSVPLFLRQRFREFTPANGGNEKAWITSYLATRRDWLAKHDNPLLRKTVYRMDTFLDAIENENWDLEDPINVFSINKVLT